MPTRPPSTSGPDSVGGSTRMLASQRHEHILTSLRLNGATRITELATEIGVSDMTVRRDLAELADRGLINRVHGGAAITSRGAAMRNGPLGLPDVRLRAMRSIAAVAKQFISPTTSIGLGGGAIPVLLAEQIARSGRLRPLTAVTNSLSVARALRGGPEPHANTVLTGGACTPGGLLMGPVARAGSTMVPTALAFIEVASFSATGGLEAATADEATVSRALMDSAARTIVLARNAGPRRHGLRAFASIDGADVIITACHPPDQDEIRALIDLVVVESSGDSTSTPDSPTVDYPSERVGKS